MPYPLQRSVLEMEETMRISRRNTDETCHQREYPHLPIIKHYLNNYLVKSDYREPNHHFFNSLGNQSWWANSLALISKSSLGFFFPSSDLLQTFPVRPQLFEDSDLCLFYCVERRMNKKSAISLPKWLSNERNKKQRCRNHRISATLLPRINEEICKILIKNDVVRILRCKNSGCCRCFVC